MREGWHPQGRNAVEHPEQSGGLPPDRAGLEGSAATPLSRRQANKSFTRAGQARVSVDLIGRRCEENESSRAKTRVSQYLRQGATPLGQDPRLRGAWFTSTRRPGRMPRPGATMR